ncbi:hypothetical protein CCACVL1_15477, partial [Corchorus capsularis]
MEVSANPLSSFCSDNSTDIYTTNSTFENNLKQLLESLPSNTAATGGFYNTSVGNGADQVYGKALCRGDVNTSTCQNCIKNGSQDILGLCNKTKEAIVWYDQCQVHYSSQKFSSIDIGKYPDPDSNKLETDMSDDLDDFKDVLELLVTNITTNATSSVLKLFGFGKVQFENDEYVYGLAQCTRDISGIECTDCLSFTVEDLKSCCYSRTGGSALRRNCNVRFQMHQFDNNASDFPLIFPESEGSNWNNTMVLTLIGVIVFVLLLLIDSLVVFYRCNKGTQNETQKNKNMDHSRSSKQIIHLILLYSFLFVLDFVLADPAYQLCSNNTSNNSFQNNLNKFFSSLPSNASVSKYYNSTYGNGTDQVYVRYMCLNYVTNEICQDCISGASRAVMNLCPNRTEAVVPEEVCHLSNSKITFFGPLNVTDHIVQDKILVNVSDPIKFQSAFNSSGNMYALVQCTLDSSPDDCNKCLEAAIKEVTNGCNYLHYELTASNHANESSVSANNQGKRGAPPLETVLIEFMVKHFVENISVVYTGKFPESNKQERNLSNPQHFNDVLTFLMKNISIQAASVSELMFGFGEVKVNKKETIYGLVQCTRDISRSECRNCLDSAFGDLNGCCGFRTGGSVLSRNCNTRFQMNKFYNASSSPLIYPKSTENKWSTRMVVTVISTTALVLVFFTTSIVVYYRRKRRRENDEENRQQSMLQQLASPRGIIITQDASVSKYYNSTYGNGTNKVYAQYMCLNYITNERCRDCIASTPQAFANLCPNTTEAVVWQEFCQLRYSNINFFGRLNVSDNIGKDNVNDFSDPVRFQSVVENKLRNLTKVAAFNSANMYATGNQTFTITTTETLYALVQCTLDLSPDNCNNCLEAAIKDVSSQCYGSRGARLLSRSCYLRYELYAFYEGANESSVFTPNQVIKGGGGGKKIWLIVVLTIASAFLVMVLLAFILYRFAMREGRDEILRNHVQLFKYGGSEDTDLQNQYFE